MSVSQIAKRVVRVEQVLSPRPALDDNTFTLEELCRSMWQRDKAAFLELGKTFPVELFSRNYEREDALAAEAERRNRSSSQTQISGVLRR